MVRMPPVKRNTNMMSAAAEMRQTVEVEKEWRVSHPWRTLKDWCDAVPNHHFHFLSLQHLPSWLQSTHTITHTRRPSPFPMPLPLPLPRKKPSIKELIRTHSAHVLLLESACLVLSVDFKFWLMRDAHTYSTWFTIIFSSILPSILHSTIQRSTAEHNAIENKNVFYTVHTAQHCAAQCSTRLCRIDRDNTVQAPDQTLHTKPYKDNYTVNSFSEQYRACQHTAWCSKDQLITVQLITEQYRAVQYSAVHLSWQYSLV